ncbi:TetR/AcrR family transcriptional regulator [Cellulomonas shaoxiangyii]|uniref:TetR/AcrR family transcriptional regulator n=1 Tax=Cellulomonas shaoxiangyii TaxID=2566013 RepID=A0A4P7SI04_9CELL|nr:TetR family transcriptional regulator [Cellulomonas shaoxiangyii]QCB93692.1 TetR/AcrR family transcriptional regulator [Cellulomonas shaoxiangyii]TGY86173.1 TetR/AcrR family transcriptional regulator [Cellulomonas shaoxiangyii]
MRDDGARTRANIRDAAHVEFAAYGLAGARVDRIAKAAGANVQRIYAYYSDKAGLFRACVLDAVANLDAAIGDDADDLVTLAGRMFDHISRDPHNPRILTWARLEIEDDLRELISTSGTDPLRRVREIAAAGGIDPRWTPEDVFVVLISLCAPEDAVSVPARTGDPARARRRDLVLHLATQLRPSRAT